MSRMRIGSVLALCLAACDGPATIDSDDFLALGEAPAVGACEPADATGPFADCVDAFEPAGDAIFGHEALPEIVLGPPQGSPIGSEHVASLGCGGRITLYFASPTSDGPGADFIVFENPFVTGSQTFAEPAEVLVSRDGATWYRFPCDLDGDGTWPPSGCAGIEPVASSGGTPSATDPTSAGGDAFDLATIGVDDVHYIRLLDRSREYFGSEMWCSGDAAGFDLDAIAKVQVD